jgi:dolichol-phosphate mannosyltransferase
MPVRQTPFDPAAALELAVVLPTFNERENVIPVLARLEAALEGIRYEVIFVDDDSPDGTADEVRQVALCDPQVRIVKRIGRRGLSSACIEGMFATAAPWIVVMDADLQHDERIIPAMLRRIQDENLDIVVGTRKAAGGSMGDFAASRIMLSDIGSFLSNLVSRHKLSDPMSGFFVLSRSYLEEVAHTLSGLGFKILLDLVASARRPVKVGEEAYTFRSRVHGESKLDILVGLEYLQLLLDKLIGDYVPVRFVIFGMVGVCGAFLHLAILWILFILAGESFRLSQAVAAVVVMTANFILNNLITYRDRRLRGINLLLGMLSFYAACSIGAVINVLVASFIVKGGWPWYIAGVIGTSIGSVWNFSVTSILTWRQGNRRKAAKQSLRRQKAAIQ